MNHSSTNDNTNDELSSVVALLKSLTKDPGNETKLKLYGLYKQATEGKCNKPRPSMTDIVGKAKWKAWHSLGEMDKVTASKTYRDVVNDLAIKEGLIPIAPRSSTVKVQKSNGVCTIILNRPLKNNAIDEEMYEKWIDALLEAGKDPEVKLVVVTGAGNYFSSGNDISSSYSNLTSTSSPDELLEGIEKRMTNFVDAFIDFPKPLIAAVNGPAVGIAVTTLALYDAVFASDNATFDTPFSKLGLVPEGCSSVTFPAIMGRTRAHAMLLFSEKITAQEAHQCGLVTRIIPRDSFNEEIQTIVKKYAELPYDTLLHSKRLITSFTKEELRRVNRVEMASLRQRGITSDVVNGAMAFANRKRSKL